jgi:hypothetical protein
MNWKYTDATERVVMRVLENGATESCLVSVISDWIAAGNTPDPADIPATVVPQSVTPLEYIERFTESEQIAIVTAAMSNAQLRLWYDKLMAAQEVVFTDSRLSAGLDALVTAGLITADRKAQLLTP